jgi:hypothetical protein
MKSHKDGTLPLNGEIWCFGSNQKGVHGAGAAKVARQKFGAKYGVGFGLTGNSYAIPTKSYAIQTLPLNIIKQHVGVFLAHVTNTPDDEYFLTRIGCILAGYKDAQIAPLFYPPLDNVSYPEPWVKYLTKEE